MSKDSQMDSKQARRAKAKNQTTPNTENQNQNRSAKKQSVKNNDV